MSNKELTKEDLKNLSHDDLMRLGASLTIKHLADSEETIVSYDRGWEIYPETAEQEGILEEVLNILTEN